MKIKNEKGITLVALVLTVIVLLILASTATFSGIGTIRSSKRTKFQQELEIMQAEVNVLYEKYKDAEIIDIGRSLSSLDTDTQQQAQKAFESVGETNKAGYRFFDESILQNLNIDGIKGEYLLDIKRRKVISLEGFLSNGQKYYTLSQLTGREEITSDGEIERGDVTFTVTTKKISTNNWEITVSDIMYSKYVGKGMIRYRLTSNEQWTTLEQNLTGDNYTFKLQSAGSYIIQIVDAAGVTAEQTITI